MKTAADTVVDRIDADTQRLLVEGIRRVLLDAPLFRPTAGSLPMSVRISNAGDVGWVADERGYRYQHLHPHTGMRWPELPEEWKRIADKYDSGAPWDCAHIVWYAPGATLGWHRDKTEHDRSHAIVTLSLGDPAEWWVRADEEWFWRLEPEGTEFGFTCDWEPCLADFTARVEHPGPADAASRTAPAARRRSG